MIESNTPFHISTELVIHAPATKIWGALTEVDQGKWNYAVSELSSTLGFHTGAKLRLCLTTTKGPWNLNLTVEDSLPPTSLRLVSSFRYLLFFPHLECWVIHIKNNTPASCTVSMGFTLQGAFKTRLWRKYSMVVGMTQELWLNSIKQKMETC